MSRAPRLLLALLLAMPLAACGYFNSFYNAQRSFAEAERAAERGDAATAARAYEAAIEKAATSYRGHPDSRWADDALLLVGRSRFAMGEHAAARAALRRAREQTQDAKLRALAGLYLGAALTAQGHPDSALAPLAEGLAADLDDRQLAFGLLWQGRARLDAGVEQGWADLAAAVDRSGSAGLEAALELGARALQQSDAARFNRALARLLANRAAQRRADTVLVLVDAAEHRFGAASLLAAFTGSPGHDWEPEVRTRIAIRHARLTAAAGDTALAVRQLGDAVQHAAGRIGGEGRLFAARWQLAILQNADDLGHVRSLLLPGIAHPEVVEQLRRLRLLEAMLQRAREGESAGFFAAAEFARDSLAAPHLARSLFLAYADADAGSVWAPKALLAALALAQGEEHEQILQRVRSTPQNPYLAAVQGRTSPAAYQAAEEQLGRAIATVRAEAIAVTLEGDVRVSRALQTLDSLRASALSDSLRVRCGALLDSLALGGIRADSVRVACMRSDSLAVAQYLAVDSLLLRQPKPDTLRVPGVVPDTLLP